MGAPWTWSAMSTMSMARSTPAQKPRGAASQRVRAGRDMGARRKLAHAAGPGHPHRARDRARWWPHPRARQAGRAGRDAAGRERSDGVPARIASRTPRGTSRRTHPRAIAGSALRASRRVACGVCGAVGPEARAQGVGRSRAQLGDARLVAREVGGVEEPLARLAVGAERIQIVARESVDLAHEPPALAGAG